MKTDTTKLILAYNYYLSFDYIPRALYSWWKLDTLFEIALSFESVSKAYPQYKALVPTTKVVKSGFNLHPDIEIFFITVPNSMVATEVGLACIAINRNIKGYLYYTAEYSFGGYAICSPEDVKNHNNTGVIVNDGAEFAQYCYKQAMEKLSGSGFALF